MSVITVVYSTDPSNLVVPSMPLEWTKTETFVITDHPFLERSVFSRNEINVRTRKRVGNDFAGLKPILFVDSLRDAVKEALDRSCGEEIVVVGSSVLINKSLKYASYIQHTTIKDYDGRGKGHVTLSDDTWRRVQLINRENEKVTKYARRILA